MKNTYKDKTADKVVIHIASEAVPYSKAGGLGDVVGTLPLKMIEKRPNYSCIVFTPYYDGMKGNIKRLGAYEVEFGNVAYKYEVFAATNMGIKYRFIKMDSAFALDNIYVDGSKPYMVDVGLEYFFLGKCITDYLKKSNVNPNVWITHDWHAAGIYGFIGKCHSIHVIHNYNHQGQLYHDIIPYLDSDVRQKAREIYEETHNITMNSFAIKMAEKIVTVSPSYAEELKNKKIAHPGLDLFDIYNKDVTGIINGVDYKKWNPAFSVEDFMEAKRKKKKQVKRKYGINTEGERPLLLMMSRLTHQKGIDFFVNLHNKLEFDIYERFKRLLNIGYDIIICGVPSGGIGGDIDTQLKLLANRYPDNFAYLNFYNDNMAKELLSGADFLFHLSNYEPCGLTPMYAMRFGAIPIVGNTGGLKDIVTDCFEAEPVSDGFIMKSSEYDYVEEKLKEIKEVFCNRDAFNAIRIRGIKKKFDWDESVAQYCELIDKIS